MLLTDERTREAGWLSFTMILTMYDQTCMTMTKQRNAVLHSCHVLESASCLKLVSQYSVKVRRLFIQSQQLRVLKSHCSWKWPPFSLIGERDTFCLIHGELFGWYQWKEERCCSLGIDEKLSPKGSKPKLFGTLIILRYALNFFYPIFYNFCQFLQFLQFFGETNYKYQVWAYMNHVS